MTPPKGLAVVSGASSGVGREIALALARRGHPLALFGRRREALEQVLAQSGADGAAWECDVRDAAAVSSVTSDAIRRYGDPEIVVPAASLTVARCRSPAVPFDVVPS